MGEYSNSMEHHYLNHVNIVSNTCTCNVLTIMLTRVHFFVQNRIPEIFDNLSKWVRMYSLRMVLLRFIYSFVHVFSASPVGHSNNITQSVIHQPNM